MYIHIYTYIYTCMYIHTCIYICISICIGPAVKNLSAMQETQVQSLGWEVPPEEGMASHSSILAWRIPWTEKSAGLYSPWGRKSQT